MVAYTKLVDYGAKDLLLTGDPAKTIKGTEVGAEFDSIAAADATNVKTDGNQSIAGVKTFTSTIVGSINGNAGTVTIADAAADTTTWPLVATAQTGNLAPATDANYTYDASANLLSVPSIAISTGVSGAGFSTYLASPPAIGGTVPAAGSFTSLSATSSSGFTASSKLSTVGAVQAGGAITVSCAAIAKDFRSTTLTSGTPTTVTTSNVDLVIPSGATLGTVTTVPARIVVVEIYTGTGTVKAVANLAGGLQMDETNLISTTAIDTASDSSNVWYSAAAQTSKPYKVVGFFDAVNTAGAWGNPTLVQPVGGEALTSMSSVGFGQTLQNVAGSRAFGTVYYNTTGKPITVAAIATHTAAHTIQFLRNGVSVQELRVDVAATTVVGSQILVGVGESYQVNVSAGTISSWYEGR